MLPSEYCPPHRKGDLLQTAPETACRTNLINLFRLPLEVTAWFAEATVHDKSVQAITCHKAQGMTLDRMKVSLQVRPAFHPASRGCANAVSK